jgi:predicted permease
VNAMSDLNANRAHSAITAGLAQDLHYAVAMLLKHPAFSLVAIVTLALGIGANAAIFSLVNTALLRPIYADKPEQLVTIFRGDQDRNGTSNHSYPDYLDLQRESVDLVSGLSAFTTRPVNMVAGPENQKRNQQRDQPGNQQSQRINVGLISDNYFRVLGVRPIAGRDFLPEENAAPGARAVALISEGLWRRQFGGLTTLTNQDVWLNNTRYTIVGVVPDLAARMAVVVKVDVFVPAMMQGAIRGGRHYLDDRRSADFMVMGRLRPSTTLSQAQTGFDRLVRHLQEQAPEMWRTVDGRPQPITVVSESQSRGLFELRGLIVSFATLLMGAVGAVLLIACGNLANVLLARGLSRRHELAIRVSLGASRARLIRLLLIESLLLAGLGGALGFLVGVWVKSLFGVFEPQIGGPLVIDLSLDARVFAFCAAITLVATLACGLAPALQVTSPELVSGLREGTHTLAGGRRVSRVRRVLLTAQVAMSVVLLMCAGLFLRGLNKLSTIDVGFTPDRVALLSVDLNEDATRHDAFVDQAIARLGRVPGVAAVDVAVRAPMGLNRLRMQLQPEGLAAPPDTTPAFAFNTIGPRYFEVMGIPLIAGRAFTPQDREGAPRVAIINEAAARRLWPDRDPIGKRLRDPNASAAGSGGSAAGRDIRSGASSGGVLEIIGVAKTAKYETLTEKALPFVYLPLAQNRRTTLTFHVRTLDAPERSLDALRRELVALDPRLPVYDVKTMHEQLGMQLLPARLGATLLGVFGALALALACIGLYGAMAYFVSQRTSEIGIRMALGAPRRTVLAMILKQGLSPLAWGTLIGLVPIAIISAVAAIELFEVTPLDATILLGVLISQLAVAALACWLPVRRAVRLDPAVALRREA